MPQVVCFLVFFFFLLSKAFAEISYLDLKGVHEQIQPKYAQLSPILGYTLLGTRSLENRRFYGNYGQSSQGYFCSQKSSKEGSIAALLKANKDCPLDTTSELIQRLFPSQDGVNFVANQIPSDPISHLKAETIGKVLELISGIEEKDLSDSSQSDRITQAIQDILFKDIHPQGFKGYLTSKQQQLRGKVKTCKKEKKESILQQIEDIENLLKALESSESHPKQGLEGFNERTASPGIGTEKDFQAIAQMIVNSLKESRLAPGLYPKYLPEQTLMAYFLKKANTKEDLLALLSGMPKTLKTPEILIKGSHSRNAFIFTRFDPKEYNLALLSSNPKQTAHTWVTQPEELIFAVMEDRLRAKPLSPIFSYASAAHSSLGREMYADCGETALRNFFNIVSYDQKNGQFNTDHLTVLNGKNFVRVNPKLIEFYKTHHNPSQGIKQKVHNSWSENIVSNHSGVKYLRGRPPQCEIDSGIDNIMNIIGHLLFHQAQKDSPIKKATSRSEKLDKLCQSVSREGFNLTWSQENRDQVNDHDTEVDIQFKVNDYPSFIWHFKKNHFYIEDLTNKKDSWIDLAGQELAHMLTQSNYTDPSHLLKQELIKQMLPWFSNVNILNLARQDSTLHLRENLIYALPNHSNDSRLTVLKEMFKSNKIERDHINQAIYKTLLKLPLEDPGTKDRVVRMAPSDLTVKEFETLTHRVPNLPLQGHFAVYSGQLELVEFLAQKAPESMEEKDRTGKTPAHYAASSGQLDVLEILNAKVPKSMKVKSSYKKTPAHYAASSGQLEVVQLLAEKTPKSMKAKDKHGNTPAHLAAISSEWEIVKFLGQQSPELMKEKNIDGNTPVHYIAASGEWNLVKFLAQNNPELMKEKNIGWNNLVNYSVALGEWDVVKLLARNNPELMKEKDRHGNTPAHLAVISGEREIVKFLARKAPESIEIKDRHGNTPAHLAAQLGEWEIVKLLAQKAPGSMKVKNSYGKTSAHLTANSGKLDVLEVLYEKDPELMKEKDKHGNTPAHLAAISGEWEVVKFFAQKTPELMKEKNIDGNTLAHYAASSGQLKVVRLLAQKAPQLMKEKNTDGDTPADLASNSGKLDIVKFLAQF